MTDPASRAPPAGLDGINFLANQPLSVETLREVAEWSKVSRVADLTGLDVLGIPVVAAVRPSSLSLSTTSGKGQSLADATVSAIMEAYEHAAAERAKPPFRVARAVGSEDDFVDIRTLPVDGRSPARSKDRAIKWVEFEKLSGDGTIWLPYDLVHLRLTTETIAESDGFLISTNGLAAGTCYEATVLHALCEVIERDAIARALDHNGSLRLDETPAFDPSDCAAGNPELATLVSALTAANISFRLNDLTHDIGVPVVHCRLYETSRSSRLVRDCDGVGCAPTPAAAICKAVMEAVQARATLISGARDDILKQMYQFTDESPDVIPDIRRHSELAFGPNDSASALAWTLTRLEAAGFPDAAVLRLDERHGVLAVRVVVPGLEGVPMSGGYVPGARGARVKPQTHSLRMKQAAIAVQIGQTTPLFARTQINKPIVFLGPSLPLEIAQKIVDAEFRPPAGQGDLLRAALRKPPAILLIDGTFLTGPSVWHKEILWAMSQGIPVFGAASLGALRAAELASLGMIGIGKVYERYASGSLIRDDLVAVQYAPAELGFAPITEAAVDIAATLDQAAAEQVIDQTTAEVTWHLACEMHFTQRTWPSILRALAEVNTDRMDVPDLPSGLIKQLKAWLPGSRTSIKATDAISALKHLEAQREALHSTLALPDFTETLLWVEMMARETNPFLRSMQ